MDILANVSFLSLLDRSEVSTLGSKASALCIRAVGPQHERWEEAGRPSEEV